MIWKDAINTLKNATFTFLPLPYFPTQNHEKHIFRGGKISMKWAKSLQNNKKSCQNNKISRGLKSSLHPLAFIR